MWTWYRSVRRRHKTAFTLIELMITVAVIGSLSALAVVKYETFVCRAQQSEATSTLHNIASAESDVFAEFDKYDPLPACTFGGYGETICNGSHIVIQFQGRSRYTYDVTTTASPESYLATATGTSGAVLGDVLTIDPTGNLDRSQQICGH